MKNEKMKKKKMKKKKKKKKEANFHIINVFLPKCITRDKTAIKIHSIDGGFVIGLSKYTICRRVCVHFSARKF